MYTKLFFFLALALSIIIQVLSVSNYNFAFTPDQAITMLSLRSLVDGKKFTLIGPETDFKGLYYGPFWYYLNVPAYIIGGRDPVALVYLTIICFAGAAVYFGKKISAVLGMLILISPVFLSTTRFSFNANFAPTPILVYFALLWYGSSSLAVGLFSGLIVQVEAALGIFFAPFAIIYYLLSRQPKKILPLILGFGLTLIPQLMFELRHGFGMTRSFLQNFTSLNPADFLPFFTRLASHIQSFANLIKNIWPYPGNFLFVFIFLACVIKLFSSPSRRRETKIFISSLCFILFCFLGFLLYPKSLTGWYLYGLFIPVFIIFTIPVLPLIKKPLGITMMLALVINFLSQDFNNVHSQLTQPSDDPSNLRNQLTTVDHVYLAAAGRGFTVYDFVPSIYDFQYQYLFWWYGNQKYGYRPTAMSYLPNVPEYILDNQAYFTNSRPMTDQSPTIFIIDHSSPQAAVNWLNYFSHLCLSTSISFPWRTEIQLRYSCKN